MTVNQTITIIVALINLCLFRVVGFTVLSQYVKALFLCRQSRLTSSCRRAGTSFPINSSATFMNSLMTISPLTTNRANESRARLAWNMLSAADFAGKKSKRCVCSVGTSHINSCLFQQFSIVVAAFQYANLVDSDLVKFHKSLALRHSLLNENRIEIFHIR